MKVLLFAAACAAAVFALPILTPVGAAEVTPAPQPRSAPVVARGDDGVTWKGFAVSPTGRVFMDDQPGREADVRARARIECERTTGRTCNAIAVPSEWDVTAYACDTYGSKGGYVGGSSPEERSSERVALNKANRDGFTDSSCRQVYAY